MGERLGLWDWGLVIVVVEHVGVVFLEGSEVVLELSQLVNAEIVVVGLVELILRRIGLTAVFSLLLSLLLTLLDAMPHFEQTIHSVHIRVEDLSLFFQINDLEVDLSLVLLRRIL